MAIKTLPQRAALLCGNWLGLGNRWCLCVIPADSFFNIWFAQMQRHLVWDCKAKESAALFFFFAVTQWASLRFLQSPWLQTLTPVDRAEEWKNRKKSTEPSAPVWPDGKQEEPKKKDSTQSKKGNRMKEKRSIFHWKNGLYHSHWEFHLRGDKISCQAGRCCLERSSKVDSWP